MDSKRAGTLSVLGRELGQFVGIGLLCFALLRLTEHFWQDALTMMAGSAVILAAMLLVKRDLAITLAGLITGILGPLAETQWVAAGTLSYAAPHVEGIPAWLFLVWGAAGIAIASLYAFLAALIAQTESARRPAAPDPAREIEGEDGAAG